MGPIFLVAVLQTGDTKCNSERQEYQAVRAKLDSSRGRQCPPTPEAAAERLVNSAFRKGWVGAPHNRRFLNECVCRHDRFVRSIVSYPERRLPADNAGGGECAR